MILGGGSDEVEPQHIPMVQERFIPYVFRHTKGRHFSLQYRYQSFLTSLFTSPIPGRQPQIIERYYVKSGGNEDVESGNDENYGSYNPCNKEGEPGHRHIFDKWQSTIKSARNPGFI
jgi:hypothetical protein